jgi:hypothetical protein
MEAARKTPALKLFAKFNECGGPSITPRAPESVSGSRLIRFGIGVYLWVLTPKLPPLAESLSVAPGAIRPLWDADTTLAQIGFDISNAPSPLTHGESHSHTLDSAVIPTFPLWFVGPDSHVTHYAASAPDGASEQFLPDFYFKNPGTPSLLPVGKGLLASNQGLEAFVSSCDPHDWNTKQFFQSFKMRDHRRKLITRRRIDVDVIPRLDLCKPQSQSRTIFTTGERDYMQNIHTHSIAEVLSGVKG